MSTIKANQWLNSDGTENYKCRAWVNFNGTGTVAIRAAGNVSSITDNGVGDYTVNFTSALPTATYVMSGSVASNINNSSTVPIVKSATQFGAASNKTTTVCQVLLNNYAGGNSDVSEIYLMFIG